MASALQRVDKLTIQIIVDNSIEWFTTLPPGFTHELPQYLQRSPKIDKRTGVPIIDLDNFCCGAHGLSILLTTELQGERYSLLFDTGPDARAFERNYDALDVARLGTIERVVLSHWHRDHSGGMTELLKLLRAARVKQGEPLVVVDLHPSRPVARGFAPPPSGRVIARLPEDPTFVELESLGARVEKHHTGHLVGGSSVWVSGEIPRVTAFETGLPGAVRLMVDSAGKDTWVSEPHIMDERYVAVDVLGKGLVIFSACSHAGIVNVVRDAVAQFARPVHMIIGGLHLGGADMEGRIPQTVDFLARQLRPAPTYVLPLHCSGFRAKIALERALGQGCVPGGVGMKIDVVGDVSGEENMFPPSVIE